MRRERAGSRAAWRTSAERAEARAAAWAVCLLPFSVLLERRGMPCVPVCCCARGGGVAEAAWAARRFEGNESEQRCHATKKQLGHELLHRQC